MIAHGIYVLTYNDVDFMIHGSCKRKGVFTFLTHKNANRRILGHACKDGLTVLHINLKSSHFMKKIYCIQIACDYISNGSVVIGQFHGCNFT
jgi:hypothetical protein